MQRTQTFTGIQVIRTQDTAMTESMGGIVDRSEEHLGTTDAAVIAARRRLLQMARDLQNGIEPSAALQPESYNVRAVDMVCKEPDFCASWTSMLRKRSARSPSQAGSATPGPGRWQALSLSKTPLHR